MKVKCEYCDSYIDETLDACPNCGAPNKKMMRSANGIPKTIDELKEFCAAHNLPLEQMHFHIGDNYPYPKAFGIYRDGENVIVYKNKADGTRAIRYQGTDEAYAVNEIYQKLKTQIQDHRPVNRSTGRTYPYQPPAKRSGCGSKTGKIILFVFIALLVLGMIGAIFDKSPNQGYYKYNGNTYYSYHDNWYAYGPSGWYLTSILDDEFTDNYSDYYESYSYDSGYDVDDFSDSDYYSYDDNDSWDDDSDWDDDNDWDDDWDDYDWDSGFDDWDSDW